MAAEPFHLVGLVPRGETLWCCVVAFAAATQLFGDKGAVNNNSGWTPINDTAHCCAVGFAEGGQPENVAEGIAHLSILHIHRSQLPVRSHHSCHRCILRSPRR